MSADDLPICSQDIKKCSVLRDPGELHDDCASSAPGHSGEQGILTGEDTRMTFEILGVLSVSLFCAKSHTTLCARVFPCKTRRRRFSLLLSREAIHIAVLAAFCRAVGTTLARRIVFCGEFGKSAFALCVFAEARRGME